MEPVLIWWDLQAPALIANRIVVGDDTLLMHTEYLRKVHPNPRDKGRARFGRRHPKTLIVGGEKRGEQLPVRHHIRNPGERQFFGQPILERAEGALRPSPRLWRIGRDQHDA